MNCRFTTRDQETLAPLILCHLVQHVLSNHIKWAQISLLSDVHQTFSVPENSGKRAFLPKYTK